MNKMQRLLASTQDVAVSKLALETSHNQKLLVESMTKQTDMLKEKIMQDKMQTDRDRAEAAEKADNDKKNWFTERTATITKMVTQHHGNSGANSESSWAQATIPKDVNAALASTRAPEYAASEAKTQFPSSTQNRTQTYQALVLPRKA